MKRGKKCENLCRKAFIHIPAVCSVCGVPVWHGVFAQYHRRWRGVADAYCVGGGYPLASSRKDEKQVKPQYILSLSYGKDSLACLGAIEKLGWPLDRIVHAEVWATDTIPADLPPMVEFKAKADEIIKKRWGIEVEHVSVDRVDGVFGSPVTYQKHFYKLLTKGKYKGSIKGFPNMKGSWCIKHKINAVKNSIPKKSIIYLGFASDEPKRIHTLSSTKQSPLVALGWTEAVCYTWCEENDLLSPIYTTATRGGCWFCHKQGIHQLRLLRKIYPELWTLMLKWDNDSPTTFKPNGLTVHDYDKRFALEDEGIIKLDEKFRWSMVENPQLRWF